MLRVLAGAALVLHGLIHLIGFVVPLRLADVEGFPYRTEILGGVDIGTAGTAALGIGWLLVAAAFVVAGAGVLARQGWAVAVTVIAAAASLLLCLAWLPATAAGALIDVAILAVVGVRAVARRTHVPPVAA